MKSSEKKLLIGFSAAVLAAGTVIGFDFYKDKARKLAGERKQLELQAVEIDELLLQQTLWETRGSWLNQNQPLFTTQAQIKNQIYQDANSGFPAGVDVENIQLVEEFSNGYYVQAGATVRATGSLESIFGWIYELQQPEDFRVVSDLRIQLDKDDDSKIKCNFTLLRWYAPR